MTYRSYILFIATCTIVSFFLLFWIVKSIAPDSLGRIGVALFYVSLGITLLGTFTLCGIVVRSKLTHTNMLRFYVVRTSFRHGLLLMFFVLASLALQHSSYLTWWNFLVLLLLFMSIELFFAAEKT